jgi:hypothetical protein
LQAVSVRARVAPPRPVIAATLRGPLSEAATVFWVALLAYVAVAALLVFVDNVIFRDALSRVASAQRILYSRDPHLAAIGFVWGPLPSLVLLPLIPLKAVWPALTQLGFAGNLVSALCMAGAVREFHLSLVSLQLRRPSRLILTGLFATHPMVVLFAANGMSEAMLLFCLLAATRHLLRWLRTSDFEAAVLAAVFLGAGCLVRYEAAIAALAAGLVVAGVSAWRASGSCRSRLWAGQADLLIIAAPSVAAFTFWFLVSWLITGHPIEQFASQYGNSSQLQATGVSAASMASHAGWVAVTIQQTIDIEPFALTLALAGLIFGAWRRDIAPLAIASTLGSVLLFMLALDAQGMVSHELRYVIVEVPLAGLMAGVLMQPGAIRLPRAIPRFALPLASAILLLPAFPSAVHALLDLQLDPIDGAQLRSIVSRSTADEQRAAARFVTERQIARDLDQSHLAAGSVLIDDFLGFPVVVSSNNPRQFVITSDRDFTAALSDPAGVGVKFVLVPQPTGLGLLDAVNRQYPQLYATGEGLGPLVREYVNSGDGMTWRLYWVTSPR